MTRRGLFTILIAAPLAKVFPRLFEKPKPNPLLRQFCAFPSHISMEGFGRVLDQITAPSQIRPDTMIVTPSNAKAYLDKFRWKASMSLEDWGKGPPWSPDALKIQRGGARPCKEESHA